VLLERGAAHVSVIDNLSRGQKENVNPKADFRCLDCKLLVNFGTNAFSGVFMLAASWLDDCTKNPGGSFQNNTMGLTRLLDALLRSHDSPKVVFSSSASVYGDPVVEPMPEGHPLNCRNVYGASKVAGELLCRAYVTQFGLKAVSLRYANVYGPRQDVVANSSVGRTAVIPSMMDAVMDGGPVVVQGDGENVYDFVHVRDVAEANVAAMASDCDEGEFNVGTGIETSLNELAERIVRLPTDGGKPACEIVHEGHTAAGYIRRRILATDAAWQAFGWKKRIEFDTGLTRTWEWRVAQREKGLSADEGRLHDV